MKKIVLAIISVVLPLVCGAQALTGSYFLDNSLNRHELNPAFAPRADYVQFLGVGSTGFRWNSNIGLSSLCYPVDGKLATFLHPGVSISDIEKALPTNPATSMEYSSTILGFGFYTANKSFWTFDLDVCSTGEALLPRDLFMFFKKGTGVSKQSFNIGKHGLDVYAGFEVSVGYSRNIFNGLRVGAKARLIAPLAYASMNVEEVTLETAPDKWALTTDGYLHTALNGVNFSRPADEIDWSQLLKGNGFSGFGYSFDFGAEYVLELGTLVDGLSVSAAVTDLGLIHYKNDAISTYRSKGYVEWTGIQDIENVKNDLMSFSLIENEGAFTRSTLPSVHVGVEMPFLKRLMSVGLLYSARIGRSYTSNELMVSYNLNPCDWFALGVNYSFMSWANALGFLMEFTPRVGPAFYVGCDYFPTEFAPVSYMSVIKTLPMSMNLSLNFGLAVHIGGKTTKENK